MDWRQRKAIEKSYREALIRVFPMVDFREKSGIYVFLRTDTEETGLRFAYVGQAKNMIARLVGHCMGKESHIDKSLIKRKFINDQNPNGWRIEILEYCDEEHLNERERYWITRTGNAGYQLLNKTSGGQDGGKVGIAPNAPARGYRDGLAQGYKNAQKEIAPLFEKYLDVSKKGSGRKDVEDRALQKFLDFIKK